MLTDGKKDLIIVPYDFTDQSQTALMHATAIAVHNQDEVRLLHVTDDLTKKKIKKAGFFKKHVNDDVEDALQEIARKNQTTSGVKTTWYAEEGDFLYDIGHYIKNSKAQFCVMGTHGVHGLQHIVGANSLKIVASSPVPVIIVQHRKVDINGYKKIVLPLDGNKRGKNKISYTAAIAKYFNSEVYIFGATSSDEYVTHTIETNIDLASDYFKENGIKYSIEYQKHGDGNFEKQLIRYAGEVGADLIAISSHHDQDGFVDFFRNHHEVQIINNDLQTAVLCVNPLEPPVGQFDIATFNW